MTIGKRIKIARKRLGLTQPALGAELGVTKQAVYEWETDQSRPDVSHLMPLAAALQVPIGWLLQGVGDPPEANYQARMEALNGQERAILESILIGFERKRTKRSSRAS